MNYSDRSVVNVTKNAVFCDLDGEIVLLNHDSGTYFGLDNVGAYIWSLIQKSMNVKEMKENIQKEYDVGPEKCEQDLWLFLEESVSAGIINICDP